MFAVELERILDSAPSRAKQPTSLNFLYNGSLPKDKEKGMPLVDVQQPKRSLDDLVLPPALRDQLERIVVEQRRSEELRNFGLEPISRALFCGPPGCGKTAAAEAVAQALFMPLVIVRFDAVVSSYLGETATNLRKVFEFATSNPVVLFLDEFDAVGKERSAEDEHGELKRVVTSLLQMLDAQRGDSVTIAASNHQGLLDSALWRRFGDILRFDPPSQADALALLERCLVRMSVSEDARLDGVAKELVGSSYADVERVALDAMKLAVLDQRRTLEKRDLDQAVRWQRNRDVASGMRKSAKRRRNAEASE